MRKLNVRWLGNLPYSEALILQKGLKESVSKEYNPYDYLLLLEHNNVITIGRTGDSNNLLLNSNELKEKGIEFFETDRGGDVTFHGKGQLIGYPIIRLQDPKKVIPFVRSLEETIIKTLKIFKHQWTVINETLVSCKLVRKITHYPMQTPTPFRNSH